MAPAKSPTEGHGRLVWLVAAMLGVAGLVAYDHWPNGDAPGLVPPGVESGSTSAPRRPPLSGADTRAGARNLNPLAGLSIDKLRDTANRPLFEATRRPVLAIRPPAAAVSKPPILEPAPPNERALALLGVIAGQGRTLALLRREATGQSLRLEEGDVIDNWTIERIEPDHIVLKSGTVEIVLKVFGRSRP